MNKVLFLCSQNKLRSLTAEHVFNNTHGFTAKSAGTDADAVICLNSELVEWADIIFVMEPLHRNKLYKKFKKIINNQVVYCLNISDDFEYMEPTLVKILRSKVTPILEKYSNKT